MPAIDLERLLTRITLLKDKFSQPHEFIKGLREIYELHSDRTHPLPSYHTQYSTISAFNTPPLLGLAIEDALSRYCTNAPVELLGIIDLLWQQPEIELRQLAALLLGRLPLEHKDMVITRIISWSDDPKDALLLPYLHEHASIAIRRYDAQTWITVLNSWKNSGQTWQTKLAIQGLITLIDDRNYLNLPAIFTFLNPLFIGFDSSIQYDLGVAVQHLIKRSEIETVYFLKQLILDSNNPLFERFIRRSLDIFSPEMQESLRNALRQHESLRKQ